jgi:hypothetical protein
MRAFPLLHIDISGSFIQLLATFEAAEVRDSEIGFTGGEFQWLDVKNKKNDSKEFEVQFQRINSGD